jgi:hypothetical protein
VGSFRYPLPRYRVLALTIALLAALWFALPLLKALAVPPDNGPIQGSATAVQDPPGSCAGRADTIPFSAVVSIRGGVLQITDPGGDTSGTINADGTADLSGQGESYHLLSSQGTTLQLREVNGGCNFLTTIVLPRVLFQVVPEPTLTSAPTSAVAAPGGVTVPASGGQSLWWLWGAGIVAGVVVVSGGWWYYVREPSVSYYDYYRNALADFYRRWWGKSAEPEGFDPVPPTEGSGDEGDDRQEIG